MFAAQKLGYEPKILVDYTSTDGARVLGTKGVLFPAQLAYLREAGYYDDYARRISAAHCEVVAQALASTWVPSDSALAHYQALDALNLTDSQMSRMCEPLGANVYQTVFAALLRVARNAGVGMRIWAVLGQTDRIVARLYHGGGCAVTRVGPKDAVLELRGVPFAETRSFRQAHCAFVRGVLHLTVRSCLVRDTPAREAKSDRYPISISWV